MYQVVFTTEMKRSLKLMKKRGKNLEKLYDVVECLASGNTLPDKHREHQLTGKYCKYKECHIEPHWLLIYKIESEILLLTFVRTGSHSDLF